jgi:DmsE family decaheme c-type cytochrome
LPYLTAAAVIFAAALAWSSSGKAENVSLAPLTLEAVASALAGSQQPATNQAAVPSDEPVAALAAFAQTVGAEQPVPDEPYSALFNFARMIGANEPQTVAAKPAVAKPVAATKAPVKGGGDAYMVGSDKCATCHADRVAEFNKTLMGRINKTTRKGQFECENCHGPGSAHVAAGGGRGVGGMNGFHPQTPEEVERDNGICLGCHEKGQRTAWHGSTHEERGLACTQCHSVMKNITPKFNLVKLTTEEVCFQCHKLQRAQMQRSSHMPVREGKITCTNCHNPHGSVYGTEAMLDAPSVNDNCYKCHAEKRGPLLWEHAPVRENCLNCHEAHGSNHESLLKVQRPRLCAECHAFAHGGQAGMGASNSTAYTVGHSCNNCHVQIHGSNHPSGAFFQR